MKKTKVVSLILITAALASCHRKTPKLIRTFHMRGDTTAPFKRTRVYSHNSHWFYAFRPYGFYSGGVYQRAGFYSSSIPLTSNVGGNSFKGTIARGGFGSGGHSISS